MVGGAQVLDQKGFFNIGKRNFMALRQIFWKNHVMISYQNVGGSANRTIKLCIKSGQASLKISGEGAIEI